MKKPIQIILLIFLTSSTLVAIDPQCLNQHNKKVDWFIALKLPDGTQYAQCDSDNCSSLKIQSTQLDDLKTSPLFNTLKQMQNINSDSYGSLFWNDQPPNQKFLKLMLTLRVLWVLESFLLVHSTPKFPEVENGKVVLEIRPNQQIFGQHYFCISSSSHEFDSFASGYNIDWPFVYESNIPSFLSKFPFLKRMSQNIRDNENQSLSVNFNTLEGVKMIKFSKSGKWIVPFYDNVPASELKTGLFVESWGSPQEEPDCDSNHSVSSNIEIKFSQDEVSYQWTKDHSKYAISSNSSKPYVCLGDINRQTTQWKRGGGTVCFKNKQVYDSFKKIMNSQKNCSQ